MSWDQGVNTSSWLYGIPDFQAGALFTYFDDLQRAARSTQVTNRKKELYNAASSYASGIASAIDTDSEIMDSALTFLLDVAQSEKSKELKVLQQYKDILKAALPQDKTIDDYIEKFSYDNLSNGNAKDLQDIYQHIVKYITTIRKSAEEYKQRLETFKAHQELTMDQIYDDDYRMRLQGEIHAAENSVVGAATKRQKDDESFYASLLRSAVGEYVVSKNILSKFSSGDDIVAIISTIIIDMEAFIQKQMMQTKHSTKLADYTTEELKKMFSKYIANENREYTRLEQAIENNEEELEDILSAAKEILGIQLTQDNKLKQSRKRSYKKQLDKSDSIINKLVDNNLDDDIMSELFQVKFKGTASNTMHGNIFELVNVVLDSMSIKVGGSAAVDTLTLGSITFTLDPSFDTSGFMSQLRNIGSAFTDYANEQRQDRFDSQEKAFIAMNDTAKKATDKINTMLRNMEAEGLDVNDIFIYHDSLKLYKSMETSELENGKFHGRDLSILNYIDELYSMNGLGDLKLPQKDALQFLALNIPSGAVASSFKGTVANFFGIFAGMLMFDDVYNLAKEAVLKINSGESGPQARNIHLYNLNGFYVPASMLLFYTHKAMTEFSKKLQSQFGAKAEISTSDGSAVIQAWLGNRWRHGTNHFLKGGAENPEFKQYNEYYSANEWARVGNAVASGVKVRVAFFAAFAQFIQSLP